MLWDSDPTTRYSLVALALSQSGSSGVNGPRSSVFLQDTMHKVAFFVKVIGP